MFSSGLAVAQERGSSGRDLITGMTAGGEVTVFVCVTCKGVTQPTSVYDQKHVVADRAGD